MKITAEIKEPQLLNIQSISDDRGLLIPFTDDIDETLFQRCYLVEDYGKGVIRGLHYHKEEVKVFTIAAGSAKFITFKLSEEMASRNNPEEIRKHAIENPDSIKTWVISNRHHAVLIIPAFYANGWISLEEHSVLVGLSNLRFEKAKNDDLRIDPYIIGDKYWKVTGR
jgi:dTDP-4-dehydrorhamnose 3,5-epimerase-like enzyme